MSGRTGRRAEARCGSLSAWTGKSSLTLRRIIERQPVAEAGRHASARDAEAFVSLS
jgi:hypothetical protein